MSPQNSDSGKPSADVFVGLLFVSITALIAGIGLLTLELGKYGWAMPS